MSILLICIIITWQKIFGIDLLELLLLAPLLLVPFLSLSLCRGFDLFNLCLAASSSAAAAPAASCPSSSLLVGLPSPNSEVFQLVVLHLLCPCSPCKSSVRSAAPANLSTCSQPLQVQVAVEPQDHLVPQHHQVGAPDVPAPVHCQLHHILKVLLARSEKGKSWAVHLLLEVATW